MTYKRGERIQRPEGTSASWYLTTLSQIRREGLCDFPIRFELIDGSDVVGRLDRPNTVVVPLGTILLADGEQVLAHDIEAFTLLPEADTEK